ncbi:hypothetical protein MBLNU459_g4695t1 [Dothideomycetes sp. NU459]
MFYDLSVEYNPKDTHLSRTLSFLAELGYNVVALNHTITGKLPSELTCAIPDPLPFDPPASLTILRRCTLVLSESATNNRLAALSNAYDILALRPVDEKTFQHACNTADCDIISLDLTQRLGYHFKFKTVSDATKRGVRLEICYSQALSSSDANAKRNLISNSTQLIRATRGGRGIIVSSDARRAVGCRAPWDVVNFATVWGLAQDRAYEAVSKEARSVVVGARLKRTSFRGVVDVVYGGDRPQPREQPAASEKQAGGKQKLPAAGKNIPKKRKAEGVPEREADTEASAKPISKREQKRRAHQARMEAGKTSGDSTAT